MYAYRYLIVYIGVAVHIYIYICMYIQCDSWGSQYPSDSWCAQSVSCQDRRHFPPQAFLVNVAGAFRRRRLS